MDRTAILMAILLPLIGAAVVMAPILAVVARGTGWTRLAEHFGPGVAEGKLLRRQTIVMRRGPYLGVVRFHVSMRALRMSLPFFLRFFHRPVSIPWTEIEPGPEETMQVKRRRIPMKRLTAHDVHLWIPLEVWQARPAGVHRDA
jgi:hypothetical protein